MGAIAAYSIAAGICLLAGYLTYKWLLATENQPALNRVLVLSIYAFAMIYPLLPSFPITEQALPAKTVAAVIEPENLIAIASDAPAAAPSRPLQILLWIYAAGMAATASVTLISILRLCRTIARGKCVKTGKYTLVLLPDSNFAPLSWMRYIIMNEADYRESGSMILTHEEAHLRCRHWLDLLLAEAVCVLMWYNPAAWLMRREMRNIHEYQADKAVITSGIDVRQYQLLLIKKLPAADSRP